MEQGGVARGMVRMPRNQPAKQCTRLSAILSAALAIAIATPALALESSPPQVIQTPFGPMVTPATAPTAQAPVPPASSRPGPMPAAPVAVSNPSGNSDGIQVDVVDGRISMTAEAVPLAELLAALDRAVGAESSVADHLQNRNISVRFRDLAFDRAVRKIFEGQSLDYLVVGEDRILVTAESGIAAPGAGTVTRTAAGSTVAATRQPVPAGPATGAPVANPFQVQPDRQQQQPIQTPFGQIFNQQGNPAVGPPAGPLAGPGAGQQQPNALFGNSSPTILDLDNQPANTPAPGAQPASTPAPGTPGQPQAPQPPQSPFPTFPIPAQPQR